MTYTPVTAFRRVVDAAQMARINGNDAPLPPQGVNKWEVLRELTAARAAFGLGDRDLAVLEALVSFHPGTILGGNEAAPVVHPSNASICERLGGMAGSTMRRHLARLVDARLITRRDSPNGKRYARRYGGEKVVFGFDLSPLARRHGEICDLAEAARAQTEALRRLREVVSLMRRDLAGLAVYGAQQRPGLALWDQASDLAALTARALRRKLDLQDLREMEARLSQALDAARDVLEGPVELVETEEMSTNDAYSEQHYQNSKTDPHDLEPCLEQAKAAEVSADDPADAPPGPERRLPNVPLGLVLASCPEISTYADGPIRHWHHLVQAADRLRPIMGISPSAWDDARMAMGPEESAVVLAAMLERYADIKSPGGYLRALTDKAAAGAFSCGPMVMALMRKAA